MRNVGRGGVILAVLGLMVGLAVAGGGATAKKKAVVVEHKTFDPAHLPTPGPPMHGNEKAVCVSTSSCLATFSSETVSQKKTEKGFEAVVSVLSVDVTVGLTITIWLPEGAPAALAEHEETHRQISEKVYEGADKAALNAAKRIAGKTFTGTGATLAAAEKDAISQAQKVLMDDYTEHVPRVWLRVNDLFDSLTSHGMRSGAGVRDRVDAKTGMKEAFAAFEKESGAGTQGAGTRVGTGEEVKRP